MASIVPYSYLVREDLKAALLAACLVGLDFRLLRWSEEERRPAQDYWELRPTRTMPPCLLPVVSMNGWRNYDDGGSAYPELRFARSDVERMGGFDVA